MSRSPKSIEELTYEQAYAELENIVTTLENEEKSLDEAIAQYERGQALAQHCADLLDKAEMKVKVIAGDEIVDFEA